MMRITRRTLTFSALATALLPGAALGAKIGDFPDADRALRVPVTGGNLFVRINGDLKAAKPPLLLVHGGPGGALWQLFPALPLAKDRAIILYDQLDSGQSDAPGDPANWTVERFVSEIDAIRLALDVKKLHLLGHSWGGVVANHYAARRPKGLQSLILQGAPLSARRAEASIKTLYEALPDDAAAKIAQHEREGTLDDPSYGKAMGMFMRKHLYRTSLRAVGEPYMAGTPDDRGVSVAKAITGGKLGKFSGVLEGFDDEPLLTKIAVPTLLLRGEFDLMTGEATRAVLPRLKRGALAEIADAGHMAQFDQPDAWRNAVSSFISRYD